MFNNSYSINVIVDQLVMMVNKQVTVHLVMVNLWLILVLNASLKYLYTCNTNNDGLEPMMTHYDQWWLTKQFVNNNIIIIHDLLHQWSTRK